MATIDGSNSGETLTGTGDADLVHALGGADTVNAQGGADTVYGGDARDTLNGGDGDDTLYGEGDKDTLRGDAGNDTLIGGASQDRLTGGTGSDTFVYLVAGDSAGSEQDVILDFAPAEDRIDLAGLLGALDLAWGGTTATPNGVWTGAINGNTLVYADLSGDTTADFRIQVNGLHALTPAQFVGVATPGGPGPALTSDTAATSEDGVQSAAGNVLANDPAAGLTVIAVRSGASIGTVGDALAGTFGSLSLAADGGYTYTLDNAAAAVQALAAGQTVQEVFTYTATNGDGSSSTTLSIAVSGANDTATLGGTASGSVTEDGATTATGTLTVSDADAGQSSVQARSNVAGSYGSFSVTAAGSWTFQLANGAANVQALNQGQSVSDTFTVTSQDGTAQRIITITVNGSDETGGNVINGSNGGETINGTAGADTINALGGADTVNAQGGADTVHGGDARDTLRGGDGDDTLFGDGDKDSLYGDAGNDTLIGGASQDRLTGGSGRDVFKYLAAGDSSGSLQDVILDFAQGQDLIDVSGLLSGTDLAWGGTKAIPVAFGVWYGPVGSNTVVYADVSGDAIADFRVQVNGSFQFTPDDFVLGNRPTGGDEPPQPVSDAALVSEEGYPMRSRTVLGTTAVGDVLGNDGGPDLVVTAVRSGTTSGTVGTALVGTYGSLTLQADGSFLYVLDNDSAIVQALPAAVEVEDTFVYTASNANGDAEATLSIFIFGADENPTAITGTEYGDLLTTSAVPDIVQALGGPDVVDAGRGDDVVYGGEGADTLSGGSDDDELHGDAGDDRLNGGTGADVLAGGAGADVFQYLAAGDSVPVAPDVILDFTPAEDRIDLSALLGATNLVWGGTTPTSNGVWLGAAGGRTIVYADVTGDAAPDVRIELDGAPALTPAVFFGVTQPGGGSMPAPVGDVAAVAEDGVPAATGNVLANDNGPSLSVTAVRFGASAGTVGTALDGAYGVLTLGADGSYTYALDNAASGVQGLSAGQTVQDVFTYTAGNGSGSVAATLTVTVHGADEVATGLANFVGTDNGETLTGTPGRDLINSRAGGDTVYGLAGNDTIYGGNGGDALNGGDGDDQLFGEGDGKYGDSLNGEAGDDVLAGGIGHDSLRGGTGSDRFVFLSVEESTYDDQDIILDFEQGQDVIDLAALLGAAELDWNGTVAAPNRIWYSGGSTTQVYADFTGDTAPEFRIQVNGSLTLTPADFIGVSPPAGGESAPAPLPDIAVLGEDNVLAAAGNVLANDGGGGLGVTAVRSAAASGTVGAALAGTYGSLTLGADGAYTYSLDNAAAVVQALAAGQTVLEVFTYTAANTKGDVEATLTFSIAGMNDAPKASDTSAATVEDTTLAGTLPPASDDTGDVVTYALTTAALHGTVVVNGDGAFSYAPDANWSGSDSFGYRVFDALGQTNGYTVSVAVSAVDEVYLAGPGDETFPGAPGADVFVFADGFGQDTITGFTVGEDRIDLSGVLNPDWTTFADVQAAAAQVGDDTLIDLGGGNTITLVGVPVTNLSAADFLL